MQMLTDTVGYCVCACVSPAEPIRLFPLCFSEKEHNLCDIFNQKTQTARLSLTCKEVFTMTPFPPTQQDETPASSPPPDAVDAAAQSEETPAADETNGGKKRSDNRLALLVFVGTLLGSLLGIAANLADATGLIEPVLDLVDPAPELRIVGSSTILGEGIPLAEKWAEEFGEMTAWQDNVPLVGEVERHVNMQIAAVGSVAGFDAAAQGQVHVLAASEEMDDVVAQRIQQQAGVTIQCAGVIGYDIITLVTDINNQLQRPLEIRELSSILAGSITDWQNVGASEARPIYILARRDSGTTDKVLEALLGSKEFPAHFIECDSNEQCLDMALSTPGSLYWVSTAWLKTQPPRFLRPVPIRRGAFTTNPLLIDKPSEERSSSQDAAADENEAQATSTFNPDHYPQELMRPLYMYVLRDGPLDSTSSDYAKQFFEYVRGIKGQEIMMQYHFFTLFDPPADVNVHLPSGFGERPDGPPVVCKESQ
jgi:ABC-type phosphate transport system substrate-binding protein